MATTGSRESGGEGPPAVDCRALSVAFREGLLGYKLSFNELRLALRLCLDSFDRGLVRGRVDLRGWTRDLGFWDAGELRVRRTRDLLLELKDLLLVDLNQAEGLFELRPDAALWSRTRATRVRALCGEPPGVLPGAELPLRDERLLSESLNELSRERVLAQGGKLPLAISGRPPQPPVTSGGPLPPPPQEGGDPPHDGGGNRPQECGAPHDGGGYQPQEGGGTIRLTFNRLNVGTIKRSERTLPHSGGGPGPGGRPPVREDARPTGAGEPAVDQVRQAVRAFVGDKDWFNFWDRAGYIWENPERVARLEGSLHFVKSGLATGETYVRKTKGAMLWSQGQIDWRLSQQRKEGV